MYNIEYLFRKSERISSCNSIFVHTEESISCISHIRMIDDVRTIDDQDNLSTVRVPPISRGTVLHPMLTVKEGKLEIVASLLPTRNY